MIEIEHHRRLSGIIVVLAAMHQEREGTGHGRQDKSAASGR